SMSNAALFRPATIVLLLACAACRQEPAKSLAAEICPSIAIAEVAASPGTGSSLPTVDGRVVSVLDPPILTTSDITAARVARAEGRDVLELALVQVAAERFRSYTANHVGSQLGFAVDGRVRRVMRVLDPIVGNGLIVDPGDTKEVASLARALGDPRCARR